MQGPFRRIAIVNRGEAAVRLIRAVRELNRDEASRLHTIALYTEPDRRALFVQEADEAYDLGSAIFADERDGRRKNRYLDYAALERALRETRAEAVWVGWGFVSEHAEFADLCERLGVVFVGPDPAVMRSLGDKIGSKRMAEEAGVPVAPWSGGPVESLAEATQHAERLGYPLMVKATAGGGGRGIRRVPSAAELAGAFEEARSEAAKGFGDATVFMERLLEGARHIEVQIIGDGHTTWALGVRDCTVQRRNQKVIEESPSPALTPEQHAEILAAAARLGDRAGYRNAGTVEFLYDPVTESFSFMEVNARLQVEHPVTECTTGVDLVKLQLHVARGGRLEGEPPKPSGHAIELRVNAEDPERGFAPSPGLVELFRLPGGPGIRIDSGFVEGDSVAPEFDSMLAKLIATGRDREEALGRLERALLEMGIAIRGGASNKGFLLGLLRRPEVRSGEVNVGWLDALAAREEHLPREGLGVAILQAAIDAYDEDLAVERTQFYATAARGRLRVRAEVGCEVELRNRGERYELRVFRVGPDAYRIDVEGARIDVGVERLGRFDRRLEIGDRRHRVLSQADGLDRIVEVDGIPHRLSRDDAGMVRAPAPAVVLQIAVKEGDEVAAGDRLAVLEAMKTELPVLAPCHGKVREVLVGPHIQVDAGAPLILLEPVEQEGEVAAGERVDFASFAAPEAADEAPEAGCRANLDGLRRLVLGYDVDPGEAARLAEGRRSLCTRLAPDDPDLLAGEEQILEAFTDVCALFARRGFDWDRSDEEARVPEEFLLLYLRTLDAAAAGLSESYVDRLQRALAHYGVRELDRTRELEESLLRICKAHERMGDQLGVVIKILERRLDHAEALAPRATEELGRRLDRIVSVTRGRYQAVSDLAREVRYRLFDRPFFEQVRREVYARADADLAGLASATGAERERRIRDLVDCAEPLVTRLTHRFAEASAAERRDMLEVVTRRYYRIRDLHDVETTDAEGRAVLRGRYPHEGGDVLLLSSHARLGADDDGDLRATAAELGRRLSEASSTDDVVLDLFVHSEAPAMDPDAPEANATEERVRAALEAARFPRPPRRVVVAVAGRGAGPGMASVVHYTWRSEDGGLREDRGRRGLHPMMGKRLQLWRLANFDVERVASSEDVYLFHGVARSNPRDERLFAFAEVRDLTPVRDEAGRVVRLPRLEMMVMEALAAMRLFQSRRSARKRLHWNRLVLYAWPPLELGVEEMNEVAHRLVPAGADLGLQKTVVRVRMRDPASGEERDTAIQLGSPGGREVEMRFTPPAEEAIAPLSEYDQKVVRMRQRGMIYPYELVRMLTPPVDGARTEFPPGEFEEWDLDEEQRPVPVERPHGLNTAKMIFGVIRNFDAKHPDGLARVMLLGDPSRELGSFAEPECRRIIAAIDLAEERGVPVEWFPVSAGAKIAMDSGTENLDWTAAALRRIVEFTQAGGEINVVVNGVNVGGQSYWNAEATMLSHTRGILIMTPEGSMVLTGKRALDYSGGVSAEDNQGIGGFDRIMGVNGQAQYWARDVGEACHLLFRHYDHCYVAPGERFPRRAVTSDPADRDIRGHAYGEPAHGFERVGEIFDDERNPGRRKPFAIRSVMGAVIDQDHEPLERWTAMREAESAVVWDAHLGGNPVCLIGMESRAIPRLGFVPADGPDQWTAGTLFPLSSKKVARAINTASRNRPVVFLANLSGFDGSPESLRRLQLEYGAEIGRSVVNFEGPMVFCVISRYHGGAYVVFSSRLNEGLEVAALEGSFASVIGGAPAAAVVFSGEVDKRTRNDPRLQSLDAEIAAADEASRGRLRARWHELFEEVRSEKLGEVASHFDAVHSVQRAQKVGSLDHIVPAARLRPYLVEAVERGMARGAER